MTEEVSFMRFGKHATPQRGARVCVYNPVIQGRIFSFSNFLLSFAYMQGDRARWYLPCPTKLGIREGSLD